MSCENLFEDVKIGIFFLFIFSAMLQTRSNVQTGMNEDINYKNCIVEAHGIIIIMTIIIRFSRCNPMAVAAESSRRPLPKFRHVLGKMQHEQPEKSSIIHRLGATV